MPTGKKTRYRNTPSRTLLNVLVLILVAIVLVVVFVLKDKPQTQPNPAGQTPEVQLDWYLANQQPVFVFFHSTTCKSCTDMMAVVDQVYPGFNDTVGLVDVDVYQTGNENLLRRARVASIPTQVFIDSQGNGKTIIGGMQLDELRTELQMLASGDTHGD